jgi:hypothetical protein
VGDVLDHLSATSRPASTGRTPAVLARLRLGDLLDGRGGCLYAGDFAACSLGAVTVKQPGGAVDVQTDLVDLDPGPAMSS